MEELVENIIRQADYYLKEAGEFYPFAAAITDRKEIAPVGVLLPNDHPTSAEVLEALSLVLEKGLTDGKYLSVAIGLDVTLHPAVEGKNDALEIRLKPGKDKAERTLRLPYLVTADKEISYGKIMNG